MINEMDDDLEYALNLAIEKLREHYSEYDEDPDIDVILDIFNNYFG